MEDLTKHQLILLALLVSFVTSIATGIATVSLLEQAPQNATRVINRVVERTVEKVVPQEQVANVITKEETVVVKEEELITDSLATASKSIARILTKDGVFVSIGFVLDETGSVITSANAVGNSSSYKLAFSDGSVFDGEVKERRADTGVGIIQARLNSDEKLIPLALGDTSGLQLGNSLLAIGGREKNQVAMGIISRLDSTVIPDSGDANINGEPILSGIRATLSSDDILPGMPVLNLFGEAVGVMLNTESGVFTPVSVLNLSDNTNE